MGLADFIRLFIGFGRVTKASLRRTRFEAYGEPMSPHPVHQLHHIRRDLAEIIESLRRHLQRKDYHSAMLDISALTALGVRIDAVTAIVSADESGQAAAVSTAVSSALSTADSGASTTLSTALSSALSSDQSTVNAAATSLASKVSSLEAAAGVTPVSSSLSGISSSLSGASTSSSTSVSSSLSGISSSLSSASTSLSTSTGPLAIVPVTLPPATIGTPYSASVSTTGGATPIAIDLATGDLPDGLTISPSGNFSGTPTPDAVTEQFVIQATDANGVTTTAAATITVG